MFVCPMKAFTDEHQPRFRDIELCLFVRPWTQDKNRWSFRLLIGSFQSPTPFCYFSLSRASTVLPIRRGWLIKNNAKHENYPWLNHGYFCFLYTHTPVCDHTYLFFGIIRSTWIWSITVTMYVTRYVGVRSLPRPACTPSVWRYRELDKFCVSVN